MVTASLEKTLHSTRPFKYLEEHELNIIKTYCKIKEYREDERITIQGQLSDCMYIILEGEAQAYAKTLGQHRVNFSHLHQGNFFGEISLIQKIPCATTVIAKTPLCCLKLSTTYFDMLALFFPNIRLKILRAIVEEIYSRLIDAQQHISQLIKDSYFFYFPKTPYHQKEKRILLTDTALTIAELKKMPFFQDLQANELDMLFSYGTLLKTPPNHTLIKPGEVNMPFFIILCGAVQLTMVSEDKSAKLIVLGPAKIFGQNELLDVRPACINFTTCERAILLYLEEEQLRIIRDSNITLWNKIYNACCNSLVLIEDATAKLFIRLNSETYHR